METWMIWLMAAGVVVLVELFTGTFYLLMVALGMAVGALAGRLDAPLVWQWLLAGGVGALASWLLHKSKYGYRQNRLDSTRNPDVNMDIGQQLQVDNWRDQGHGRFVARAHYRGAQWDVQLQSAGHHGQAAAGDANDTLAAVAPGMFRIVEVQGSCLIVKPM